jgi:plasmid stability protein
MSKMIQIRNVPDKIHRRLKVRAARAGMTLSDFLLREVTHVANRPELSELLGKLERRRSADVSESPAEVLRAERESAP